MLERIKFLFSCRGILRDMAVKELKAKYTNSILGISWALINPLLIMLAVSFVFTQVFKVAIKDFALFLLSGIIPWMFFSTAVSECAFSITNQPRTLHQFNIPKEILPLSSLLANFLNFALGWVIILPVFLAFRPEAFQLLPLLLVVILLHLIFIAGLGLFLSALNVFFRDTGHLLGVILMFWLWVTPVFYGIDMLPPGLRGLYELNPMAAYILSYRDILFFGSGLSVVALFKLSTWAAASFIGGEFIFLKLEPRIAKRI